MLASSSLCSLWVLWDSLHRAGLVASYKMPGRCLPVWSSHIWTRHPICPHLELGLSSLQNSKKGLFLPFLSHSIYSDAIVFLMGQDGRSFENWGLVGSLLAIRLLGCAPEDFSGTCLYSFLPWGEGFGPSELAIKKWGLTIDLDTMGPINHGLRPLKSWGKSCYSEGKLTIMKWWGCEEKRMRAVEIKIRGATMSNSTEMLPQKIKKQSYHRLINPTHRVTLK